MSTLAYILLAASGGSKDSNFFLGAATGASANSRSQDTFKFSLDPQNGGSMVHDSDGNLYFGYNTTEASTASEGVGIAKFDKDDVSGLGSMTGLFKKVSTGGSTSLYQGITGMSFDQYSNLVFLVRGDFDNARNAIMKLGDRDAKDPSNWAYNKAKAKYFGDSSFTQNMYDLCFDKSIFDTFYAVGHTQAVGLGNQGLVQKWDMNNPTGTPAITWSKKWTNNSSYCDFFCCDSDDSGNLYVGGKNNNDRPIIVKFNSSGAEQWATEITNNGFSSRVRSIVSNEDGSVIIATYQTENYGSQDSSRLKVGVLRVNGSNGAFTWNRVITKANANQDMLGSALALDSSDNWYMLIEGQGIDSNASTGIISGNSSGTYRWATKMENAPLVIAANKLNTDTRGHKRWLSVSPDDSSLFFCTTSVGNQNSINYRGMGQVPSDGTGTSATDFVINSSNLNFTGVNYNSVTLALETVTTTVNNATGSTSTATVGEQTSVASQNSSDWDTTTGSGKVKNTFDEPYTSNF